MKFTVLFLTGIALAFTAMAQELAFPESVNTDGKFLYVSNIGAKLDPSSRDGDGFISKLSLDGKMITQKINADPLDAPKGSGIIKGILYVCDVDRIVGIELTTGKKVTEISLSQYKTSFLNDVAVKDDHTLYVSATDIGKIFEVSLKDSSVRVLADVKGVNGIAYANKKLYTNSFFFDNLQGGEVGVITNGKYEKIGNIHGAFDGIAVVDANTLIVSDWGAMDKPAGFVLKIDLKTKTATKLDWPVMGGPADFCFSKGKLYIPAMVEGKILIKTL